MKGEKSKYHLLLGMSSITKLAYWCIMGSTANEEIILKSVCTIATCPAKSAVRLVAIFVSTLVKGKK